MVHTNPGPIPGQALGVVAPVTKMCAVRIHRKRPFIHRMNRQHLKKELHACQEEEGGEWEGLGDLGDLVAILSIRTFIKWLAVAILAFEGVPHHPFAIVVIAAMVAHHLHHRDCTRCSGCHRHHHHSGILGHHVVLAGFTELVTFLLQTLWRNSDLRVPQVAYHNGDIGASWSWVLLW
jgi:hypothetical protein